ncbi:MAG: M20/M25/M40 family metallo-hydrolase [Planctomycetaceae bacterium]
MPVARIDEKAAVKRVMDMIAIPGRSGEEAAIAAFVVKQLKAVGVKPSQISYDSANKKSPIGGEIGNLIVKLPGTVKGPRRLLMGHIDTVPLCVGAVPVKKGDYIRPKNKTTALGGDNRAGACVALTAAIEILKRKLPHPPLTLFFPIQEEIGLNGARFLTKSKLGNPKLCFNWDGGSTAVATIGATGAVNMDIEVTGIASHAGAHPENGASAAVIASKAIASLYENGWHGDVKKGKKTGTSNIGVVEGGDATNVVMPLIKLRAEARSHNTAFRKKIAAEFEKAFKAAAKSVKNAAGQTGSVSFDVEQRYDSFAISPKEPVVQAACEAIKDHGIEPVTKISNGGLDANWLTAHGFPTVTLGCGQAAIHTVDEELHIPSFLQACSIGLMLATDA